MCGDGVFFHASWGVGGDGVAFVVPEPDAVGVGAVVVGTVGFWGVLVFVDGGDGGGAEFSGESSVGDGVVGVEPEVFGFVVVHTNQTEKDGPNRKNHKDCLEFCKMGEHVYTHSGEHWDVDAPDPGLGAGEPFDEGSAAFVPGATYLVPGDVEDDKEE